MLHTLLLYLLFAMKWMTVELVDYGALAACCKEISDKNIPVNFIKGYVLETTPLCPLNAIRFITIRKRFICSNPESAWAKKTKEELDNRTRSISTSKPQTTWTKPSTTTTTPATTKHTSSTKATTPTVSTEKLPKESPTTKIKHQSNKSTQDLPIPTTITSITQLQSTTEEPTPTTTIPPQQRTTTPRTTKMTSAEAPVTTQPLQFESTASTVITTTTLTTSTVTAAGPQTTTSPPVQKTDSTTVRIQTTHPHPSRTLTKEHQDPIFHKKPWTDRRLKKKKRSGLRKAQRKLSG